MDAWLSDKMEKWIYYEITVTMMINNVIGQIKCKPQFKLWFMVLSQFWTVQLTPVICQCSLSGSQFKAEQ
jgi:hypothetical protein